MCTIMVQMINIEKKNDSVPILWIRVPAAALPERPVQDPGCSPSRTSGSELQVGHFVGVLVFIFGVIVDGDPVFGLTD